MADNTEDRVTYAKLARRVVDTLNEIEVDLRALEAVASIGHGPRLTKDVIEGTTRCREQITESAVNLAKMERQVIG